MNAVEIEQAISDLALQSFDAAGFPYAFLAAFGNKDTTLKRLRSGNNNTSDLAGVVFEPAQLTVNAGQRVVWFNDDGAPHGVRFNDGTPGQDLMLPGQSFSHVYTKPDVYDYVCSVHPYMTARVTVRAS